MTKTYNLPKIINYTSIVGVQKFIFFTIFYFLLKTIFFFNTKRFRIKVRNPLNPKLQHVILVYNQTSLEPATSKIRLRYLPFELTTLG